jgi:hypothetical protein
MAGVGGLELRNPYLSHVFEKTRQLAAARPKSAIRDYSRLSCGVADTQVGPGFRPKTLSTLADEEWAGADEQRAGAATADSRARPTRRHRS